MTVPKDIPHIVKRLLQGGRRSDDLHRLFEWVRDDLPQGSPVRDVGDFDAHRDRRHKGLTWEYGIAFCARQRLGLATAVSGVVPTLDDLKRAQLTAGIFAKYDQFGLDHLGLTYPELQTHLKSAMGKITSFDGKIEQFATPLSPVEQIVYDSFRVMRSVPLAFTAFSVTSQLADILVARQVMPSDRKASFLGLQCLIATFVISRMHLTQLDLKDVPGSAFLQAGTHPHIPGKLVVHIHYDPPESASRLRAIVKVFQSNCDAQTWVSPGLHSQFSPPFEIMADWSQPLDLDERGRLCPFETDPSEGASKKVGALRFRGDIIGPPARR